MLPTACYPRRATHGALPTACYPRRATHGALLLAGAMASQRGHGPPAPRRWALLCRGPGSAPRRGPHLSPIAAPSHPECVACWLWRSETCPIGQLYIVSRGAALFAGRAFLFGKTFGEGDALLTNPKLRSSVAAAAISYLFTYAIDGEVLRGLLDPLKYPLAYARIRRRQILWIFRRGLVRLAEDELQKRMKRLRVSEKNMAVAVPRLTGNKLSAWNQVVRVAQCERNSAAGVRDSDPSDRAQSSFRANSGRAAFGKSGGTSVSPSASPKQV